MPIAKSTVMTQVKGLSGAHCAQLNPWGGKGQGNSIFPCYGTAIPMISGCGPRWRALAGVLGEKLMKLGCVGERSLENHLNDKDTAKPGRGF